MGKIIADDKEDKDMKLWGKGIVGKRWNTQKRQGSGEGKVESGEGESELKKIKMKDISFLIPFLYQFLDPSSQNRARDM